MHLFKTLSFATFTVLWIMIFAGLADAQEQGLHNSSKVFSAPADISWKDWADKAELQRTWDAALAYLPIGSGQSKLTTITELGQTKTSSGKALPTIIYMHGCSGFWSGIHVRLKLLADKGFLVIAPASLARAKYPKSCDVERKKGGLFRGTLKLRQNDAGYAIEQARQLPIVDGQKLVLMGFSEGAVVAATFEASNEQQKVRARIVEGWTCQTPWPEYKGVNAPVDQPVLTLVAEQDPWFQSQWTKGNCGSFLNGENGSKSIVYRDKDLINQHALLETPLVQRDIFDFLETVLGQMSQ